MADNSYKISKSLNLNPQAGAPSNPTDGDVYYDSTVDSFVYRTNGAWANLDSATNVTSSANMTSSLFTPSVVQNSVIRVTGSGGTIHGMAASFSAKKLIIYNASSATITVKHNSSTETTANNKINTPISGDMDLVVGEVAQFIYDSTASRWLLVSVGSGAGMTKTYVDTTAMRPHQNLVVNGLFDFWQRGASDADVPVLSETKVFRADRWYLHLPSAGSYTFKKETGTWFPSIAVVGRGNGDTNTSVRSFVHEVDRSLLKYAANQKLALTIRYHNGANRSGSWKIKVIDSATGNGSEVYLGGTDYDTPTTRLDETLSTSDINNEVYVLDYTEVPLISNMAIVFEHTPSGTAGADDTLHIHGVMLQLGDTSPVTEGAGSGAGAPNMDGFVRAGFTLDQELYLCRRFYEKSYEVDTDPTSGTSAGVFKTFSANVLSSDGAEWILGAHPRFKVSKIKTPAVTVLDHSGTPNSWVIGGTIKTCGTQNVTREAFEVTNETGADDTPSLDMTYGHWTADAEY